MIWLAIYIVFVVIAIFLVAVTKSKDQITLMSPSEARNLTLVIPAIVVAFVWAIYYIVTTAFVE